MAAARGGSRGDGDGDGDEDEAVAALAGVGVGGCRWARVGWCALSAQNSMDEGALARVLAGLAGFVAMLLALAICRVRRILGGLGWRRAEPKSNLGISTSFWPEPACKRQLRRERGRGRGRGRCGRRSGTMGSHPASTVEMQEIATAGVGVYDHLRRGKSTGTLVASCGLHHLMDSQMSISGSKT